MAKSLGQLHTSNHFISDIQGAGEAHIIDLSSALTSDLERMIRQGQSFKVVGIDMALNTVGTLGGGQIMGYLRYYRPTRGRVLAYRNAFKAMKTAMSFQGVSPQSNKMYDFRPCLRSGHQDYANQATLDGTNGLVLHDAQDPDSDHSVFGVYNRSVEPTYTGTSGDLYPSGFNTLGVQNTPTDFVLNDEVAYSGNALTANTTLEFIPFTLTWTPDTTDLAVEWQWRPDPALYLSIMTGQFEIVIDEINKDGGAGGLNLAIAVHVSGWKSLMSDSKPKKKKPMRRKKSSRRRTKR